MKKILTLIGFVAIFGSCLNSFAADLMVAEGGAGGAYATIVEAIDAAADGDRIIIVPKGGGSAYAEDLTISKSLQFLSNDEGVQFVIQGSITITPANGRIVSFIGMKNLQGTITASGSNAAGTRCRVNLLNCSFMNGNVNFDFDNFYINLASSVINGKVLFRYGKAIGNEITANGIGIMVSTDAYATNDTIWVVGNKIVSVTASSNHNVGVYWNNTSQFFYVANNFISFGSNYNNGYVAGGFYASTVKNSSNGRNTIVNNTIIRNDIVAGWYNNARYGIAVLNTPASTYTDLMNNIILGLGYGIDIGLYGSANSGVISSSYTFMNGVSTSFNGFNDDGTNNVATNATLDSDGRPAGTSDCIDAGNPDSTYYDIDLTRNDIGCYGGSFTLDNFYPVEGAARVYFMLAPRRITVGNTLGIKAESFDR